MSNIDTQGTPHLTLSERLTAIKKGRARLVGKKVGKRFDVQKPQFGFGYQSIIHKGRSSELKGILACVYDHPHDALKYVVKLNPLSRSYNLTQHPTFLESGILRALQACVRETPHLTACFGDLTADLESPAFQSFRTKRYKKCSPYPDANVLVSEYVCGGGLDHVIDNAPEQLSDEVWRYTVFSVMWTLAILQDKYGLVHADTHFGNVLLDTSLLSAEEEEQRGIPPTYVRYEWVDKVKGDTLVFHVRFPGVLAKLWDFEFANVYKPTIGM
ncbi:hypothetical protein HDU93_006454, partial [Gonapodya sp. JEL0774]